MYSRDFSYQETSIDHLKGEDYWGVSSGEQKWINKLLKYSQTHPNDVKIISKNSDGSIYAHVPKNWLKISPPRKMSAEQIERFKQMIMDKNSK